MSIAKAIPYPSKARIGEHLYTPIFWDVSGPSCQEIASKEREKLPFSMFHEKRSQVTIFIIVAIYIPVIPYFLESIRLYLRLKDLMREIKK